MLDRRDRVLCAADHQGRRLDRTQLLAKIGIAHRRAVGRVAIRRSAGDHLGDTRRHRRVGLGEGRREPARDGGIAHVAHGLLTAGQHALDARVPDLIGTDFRPGIAQHQALEAIRGMDTQPLADQSAHGQPAEGEALDAECSEHTEHVMAQLLDAVWPRRDARSAMATGVVAQHAEMLGEGRNLRVPHVQVGAQGIGKHQHRRALRAVESVVQADIGQLYARHRRSHSFRAWCSATARSTQRRAWPR